MFDFSFGEMLVVALVALVVLGPERLPKAARFAGLWVRRARAQWYSVKAELENELADEELKRSLRQAQEQLREAEAALRAQAASVEQGVQSVARDVQAGVAELGANDASTPHNAPAGDPDNGMVAPAAGKGGAPSSDDRGA